MVEESVKKIYLFTGENTYSLSKELKRWKDIFAEKNGKDSIFLFNRENRDYGQIKQTIFGGGFFITNKLVILEGVPLDTEKSNIMKVEEIEKITEDLMNYKIPTEVLVICVSYKPDKRSRFYKRFDKIDKKNPNQNLIKSFAPLNERELPNFVKQEGNDLNLTGDVVDTLIRKVGNDQFRLSSEIDKLRYWKKYYGKEITPEIVDQVCFGMIEEDIFKLLDLAFTKPESAIKFIQTIQENGMDWNALNGSFVWGLRNYLLVLDYAEHGITDSKYIATELKQNPWSIINIIKKLPQLKEKKNLIKNLFYSIVDIDYDIKNGNSQSENYFFTIKKVLLQK